MTHHTGVMVGQHLGNYRIIRLLGQGGFAEVYLAEHVHLSTQAAIKVLTAGLTSEELETFRGEARTIAHLEHPHIVRVLDFGVQNDTPFLVMNYAQGGSLRAQHPKGSQLPLDTIVSYVKQISAALQYAHDEQVIHRDIKPENVLLGKHNEVLLSDFGLAVIAQSTHFQQARDTAGTTAYMAPEQLRGHPGPASDQYALGIMVYEWLCGERPFSGSFSEMASQHLFVAPASLCAKVPTIPSVIELVVLKALAKDPNERFASVQAFALALEKATREESSGQTFQLLSADNPFAPKQASQHNLPMQLTLLLGREQEVMAACTLLRQPEVRLVTLTGAGGIGKTRMGLQIATDLLEDFADGVCFVPLTLINDPELVIPTIAQALGIEETEARSLFDLLNAYLRDKCLLLLLDNFEQIVSAASKLTELLAVCPHLKILVTSRAVLHVQGEHEFPVPPLAVPDLAHLPESEALSEYASVALFLQRAQAIKSDFQMTKTNARTIVEICARLDGLPLAIELAAARIKLLPPQALLTRLEHRLHVLTSGAQDMPERQQTLRNTIQWSYDLLSAEEQRLFRQLSVFVGGCTLEAAESVCAALGGVAETVLDRVASLIDKSLLQQREQEDEEPRFLMLEVIREYGLEMLKASGEAEAVRQAHAAYYQQLVPEAEPKFVGPQQSLWLERLEQEHDNLRAALEWALEEVKDEEARDRKELALRLSAALEPFWVIHGHYREARTFLERVLAGSEGESASLRIRALQATATIARHLSDYDRTEVLAQQSLTLSRELGYTRGIANSLSLLAVLAWTRGKTAEALALNEERVRLIRQISEPGEIASALFHLADQVSNQGEYAWGQVLFEEALLLFRNAGNELWVGATLVRSAFYLWLSASVDVATVRQRLQQGQALITRVGDRHWVAESSSLAAMVALSEGKTARAYDLAQESLSIYREMDDRWNIAVVLHILGRVEAQRSDLKAARRCYVESLALARELGDNWITPFNLEGLAGVLATQGELKWAAQLWGAAEVLRETAFPLPAIDRPIYERAVVTARVQLGEQDFAGAWAEGRTMTPEQALAAKGPSLIPVVTPTPPDTSSAPLAKSPASLRTREVEVLRLVAQGLTDAQIAEQLVITRRTVNWYLTSIYSKIGVSSRSAATRYAIERNLV